MHFFHHLCPRPKGASHNFRITNNNEMIEKKAKRKSISLELFTSNVKPSSSPFVALYCFRVSKLLASLTSYRKLVLALPSSLTHSFTHSITHSLTHSLTHSHISSILLNQISTVHKFLRRDACGDLRYPLFQTALRCITAQYHVSSVL